MMPSYSSLLLFVTGAVLLLVIPGPAVLYILSRGNGSADAIHGNIVERAALAGRRGFR
jgi:threonine/homoserine/homoserine lactone efflux protein